MKESRLPAHLEPIAPIEVTVAGVRRLFDIDDPVLPDWVAQEAMTSGGYPYAEEMKKKDYEAELEALQVELVKVQVWQQRTGERVAILFEGRDAAGKGGAISALRENMNPRTARDVALPKPTETETGQWYFQRYVRHFPTRGEFVTFDRSWYNRAGVEPVMGFCTPAQHRAFLRAAPKFERMIVEEGIRFFKFWLDIGQEMQLVRFHDRRHSRLKFWKFSPIDIAGITRWDDYSAKRDLMFARTDSAHAPWIVVRSNDKRRARLSLLKRLLSRLPYDGRDDGVVAGEDPLIIGSAGDMLERGS
jgi:polyphosphate kinase 2